MNDITDFHLCAPPETDFICSFAHRLPNFHQIVVLEGFCKKCIISDFYLISRLWKAPSLTILFVTDYHQGVHKTMRNRQISTSTCRKRCWNAESMQWSKSLSPAKSDPKFPKMSTKSWFWEDFASGWKSCRPSRWSLDLEAIWEAMSETADKISFRGCA